MLENGGGEGRVEGGGEELKAGGTDEATLENETECEGTVVMCAAGKVEVWTSGMAVKEGRT